MDADAEPIAHWPDGSVKWLRLDFISPAEQSRLRLDYGAGVSPASPRAKIDITEDDQAFYIDTGALRFELGKSSFALLRNCTLLSARRKRPALQPQGLELETRCYFRRPRFASVDESYSCRLEEHGQVHAVFLIEGAHQDKRGKLLDYRLRLHCWADSSALRLSYTLRSRQEDELPLARAVEISLPLSDGAITFSAGMETGLSLEGEVPDDGLRLTQTGPTQMRPDERFQYAQDGLMVGRRSEGWISASGEAVGVTATVRRFWQQHPKGFELHPDRMLIKLWPEETGASMVLPRACEKTYDIQLHFHETTDNDLAAAALTARAFGMPALVVATPGWYCSSGAFGELIPAGNKGYEDFARAAAGAFASLKKRRAQVREYGDFDYGDFSDDDTDDGWFNVEYDTPHCLLTQFARTARRDYFDWGIDAASHQADIDIAHCVPTDPNLVGSQSIHATGHLGRESKWFYYRTDHIWAQGLVKAYWLTGDRRYLETARLVGDYLVRVDPCPDDGGSERAYAWSLIGLMAVYDATLDEKYLTAASRVARQVLDKAHPQRGLWLREWGTDENGDPIYGSSPFMAGLLLEGLIDYNAVARDPAVDDFIVKSVRTLISESWIEKDGGFHYNPGLNVREMGRPADLRQIPGLLYAYELTRDKSILDVALRSFTAGVKAHLASVNGLNVKGGAAKNAKNYAIFLRPTLHFIAALRRLKVRVGR